MSEIPEVTQGVALPFVPVTTPTIERGNRLLAIRQHPGFNDLIRIGQDLVQEAMEQSRDFGGWDPQQIAILKARHQAAYEYHVRFLARIQAYIEQAITEVRAAQNENPKAEPTAQEILDNGDFVRQEMLKRFEQMDKEDNRPAGSY